jgi:hypothetical protein
MPLTWAIARIFSGLSAWKIKAHVLIRGISAGGIVRFSFFDFSFAVVMIVTS